jgi:hypothetical protein
VAGSGADATRGRPCYARDMTQRSSAARRPSAAPRVEDRRPGRYLGPLRITPARVTLLVALIGGLAFLAYATLIRDQLQVPLMATGFAVCGIVLAAMAVMSVAAVMRAGREGRDAAAVLTALAGGLVAIAALLLLAGAVIMSLIWSGTKSA